MQKGWLSSMWWSEDKSHLHEIIGTNWFKSYFWPSSLYEQPWATAKQWNIKFWLGQVIGHLQKQERSQLSDSCNQREKEVRYDIFVLSNWNTKFGRKYLHSCWKITSCKSCKNLPSHSSDRPWAIFRTPNENTSSKSPKPTLSNQLGGNNLSRHSKPESLGEKTPRKPFFSLWSFWGVFLILICPASL